MMTPSCSLLAATLSCALSAFCLAEVAHAQDASASAVPPSPAVWSISTQAARFDPKDPHCQAPPYPEAAKRALAAGVTTVRYTVDATGRAAGAVVTKPSGPTREHKVLDGAASSAMLECPFKPALDAMGQPTQSYLTVSFTWHWD
jgi:protein TonB